MLNITDIAQASKIWLEKPPADEFERQVKVKVIQMLRTLPRLITVNQVLFKGRSLTVCGRYLGKYMPIRIVHKDGADVLGFYCEYEKYVNPLNVTGWSLLDDKCTEIKDCFGSVLYKSKDPMPSVCYALDLAMRKEKKLTWFNADLRDQHFDCIYFSGNFSQANFSRSSFGSRANLHAAYLPDANFTDADMNQIGTSLNASAATATFKNTKYLGGICNSAPLFVKGLYYDIVITEQHMAIDCQTHTHAQWESFNDEQIDLMDPGERDRVRLFWANNRDVLLKLCENKAKTL